MEKICVIPWGWGHKGKGDCYRAGDETVEIGPQEQKERHGFTFGLLASLAGMAIGLSGVPDGTEGRNKAASGRSEVRRRRSVGSTEDLSRRQEKPQVFHYRAREETGVLDLGEQREKRRSAFSPSGFLVGVA